VGDIDSSGFSTILKTNDGGANWTVLTGAAQVPLLSVFFTDANTGYAVGDLGTILKTTNGGTNWSEKASGTTVWLTSVYFPNATTGFVVGEGGTILRTTDGGNFWTPISSGTLTYFGSVFFADVNTGYAVGYDGKILKTVDGGINWNFLRSVAETGLSSIYFPDPNTGYAVGSMGTILKTDNGGGPVGISEIKNVINSLKLYPNPTSGKLTIETPEKGTLSVFNLNGMLLQQRELAEPTSTIDFNTLPGGVYFVKLVGSKGVQVGKFVKQ
jgi:photosystem II stability/assembly factor-like uncharacterized protein